MKRRIACILCGILLLCLAACGTVDPPVSAPETSPAAAPSDSTPSETSGQPHTLVVYFSATGSTRKAAEIIADTAGGEIFAITPAVPYSDSDLSWTNADSRVCREHNDPDHNVPLTETIVPDWNAYDTVYIGYPIWWGGAAFPVEAFVKANDFTGKAVIPFCTSASSGLGNSAKALAALCGTGNWQAGQRFSSSADAAAIREWVTAQ